MDRTFVQQLPDESNKRLQQVQLFGSVYFNGGGSSWMSEPGNDQRYSCSQSKDHSRGSNSVSQLRGHSYSERRQYLPLDRTFRIPGHRIKSTDPESEL